MDVLLLPAGIAVSWIAGRPGDGDDGRSWASRSWGGLASFGDFARVVPAGCGCGCAAIMLKSLDFPGIGISRDDAPQGECLKNQQIAARFRRIKFGRQGSALAAK